MVGPSLHGRLVGQRPAIRPYARIPGPLDPNRLATCCCMVHAAGGQGRKGGGVFSLPLLDPPMIMLCCTRALLGLSLIVQPTTKYRLHCIVPGRH